MRHPIHSRSSPQFRRLSLKRYRHHSRRNAIGYDAPWGPWAGALGFVELPLIGNSILLAVPFEMKSGYSSLAT